MSTARAWSIAGLPDQTGRTVIVTGANTGLGKATARALAGRGALVVMACRNEAKALAARNELTATGVDPRQLAVRRLDLGDQASVRGFAEGFLAEHDRLDLLINNAGLSGTRYAKTVDGYETQFGVNHLGHMALTLRLLPAVVATPGSRVVTLSSGAHRFGRIRFDDPHFDRGGYRAFPAYAQSKLANYLFSAELGRRLATAGHRTISVAVDPGFARTELGTKQASRTQLLVMRVSYLLVPSHSAETGAGPTLRAATDPNAASGQLYAPRLGTRGGPVAQRPSRRTTGDPQVAARLWDASLTMLGLEPPAVLAHTDR
ncbi:oxidoreductase [Acrocarpospora macrocephala]|uniref:Short-chain dehydrogenase n=1 Tax=Acrocarpospora macrocephala TaxID=150177 RepID=A0A5M3X4Y4_9ACTN|nr:oxidoreductase [Acrocarpospora macrocephala]GES15696.1 short-chain dehydrogenase [Acrocarpospora macrocephala]